MIKVKTYSPDDIPKYTKRAQYKVDVSWVYLENQIASEPTIDLDPDFQRGHVWDENKQIKYVEFIMRGGNSSKDLQFNCSSFGSNSRTNDAYVLVDGKQRLEAVRKFMRGDLKIFGNGLLGNKKPLSIKDFSRIDIMECRFGWNVNDLATRKEVLQWYLDLNEGGVVHTQEELNKVKMLMELE